MLLGPSYKLAGGDPTSEEVARKVTAVLDQLRAAYGFALVLEAHSPHGQQGGTRPKRPYGASLWLRWPEFGLHLDAHGSLTHWRGARDERDWPLALKRGGEWPWSPEKNPREVLWFRIVAHAYEQSRVPSEQALAAALGKPKTTIHRSIAAHETEWLQLQEKLGLAAD